MLNESKSDKKSDVDQALCDRFAMALKTLDISALRFGQECSIHPTSISRSMSGVMEPSKNALFFLAERYNVDLNWLCLNRGTDMFYGGAAPSNVSTMPLFGKFDKETHYMVDVLYGSNEEASGPTKIPALKTMCYPHMLGEIFATKVSNESMSQAGIDAGDYVFATKKITSGDGIYVLQVNGDLIVKRVEFDVIESKIQIKSDNAKYPEVKVISRDAEVVKILGRVLGVSHSIK